jgi:hypothetical protein
MRPRPARTEAGERAERRGSRRALAVIPVLLLAVLPLAALASIAQAAMRYPETIRFGRAEARSMLKGLRRSGHGSAC